MGMRGAHGSRAVRESLTEHMLHFHVREMASDVGVEAESHFWCALRQRKAGAPALGERNAVF